MSARQERERASMERAGVLYVVVRSPEDLESALLAAGLVQPILLRMAERPPGATMKEAP